VATARRTNPWEYGLKKSFIGPFYPSRPMVV
jgi:hypothetical protein